MFLVFIYFFLEKDRRLTELYFSGKDKKKIMQCYEFEVRIKDFFLIFEVERLNFQFYATLMLHFIIFLFKV